jgi:ATP-dependent helicase HepA
VSEISFLPGQRWVSNTESELGLGIVVATANRRVEMSFPAAGGNRVYATDNAPLSRVHYQAGERVSTEDGRALIIDEVMEANGCLIYGGLDESGQTLVVPEKDLNSSVQFSKPQDRLFAGQIDKNRVFELRCETLEHSRSHQQSPVLGLLGSRVQLLPHQLYIAAKVASRHAPRVLLADEVGLGKTIEAGLILHQQLISGSSQRVLIVVPDSLLHQWLVEMLRRFNLRFTIVDQPDGDDAQVDEKPDEEGDEDHEVAADDNPFEDSQLVLCTLSYLCNNPERHAQALAADWDMLVVDEAHHLQWNEQQASAEYRCIEALAGQARGLLLLTATPEQLGIASHFARLRLLDPDRYYDLQTFIDEEKKHQPVNRLVQDLLADDAHERLVQSEGLREELSGYLDEARLKPLLALLEAAPGAEFAEALNGVIRDLLDRHGTGRVLFRNTRASVGGFPDRELTSYPLQVPEQYLQNIEQAELSELLTPEVLLGDSWLAEDPRVTWLADFLVEHRSEKVLVICARAETAVALEEYLRVRAGVLSAVFYEGLSLVARDRAAAYFSDEEKGAQVLVCSEIGSEGRNFQFAHHLVLFDLPLHPDLLEQRIGRLDRIGQRNTVQVHAPVYSNSAQSVLLDWYHLGLGAIETTFPAGQVLFEQFESELMHCLRDAGNDQIISQLLQSTRGKAEETLLALQQGRDRLLELNSFNSQRADEIIDQLVEGERRKVLSDYMDQVFEHFGIEQEHHSSNSLVLRPADHMLEHSLPGLPEDGMTATYQRDLALHREDFQYLSWEHPLVGGAMDLILNGEYGNTAFCTLKLPPLKPGTILLEAIFTLSAIAPGDLQLHRFLPLTTVRLVVDHRNTDLSGILSSALINRLAERASLHNARELVRQTRPRITVMLEHAEQRAEAQKDGILNAAIENMQAGQQVELERIQALAAVNPNIREEEIRFVRETTERLEHHLNNAQLRLDAIRVAMVTE